ncbi:MAG: hypothetical protein QOJ26_829 [Thermoplasmata archaeon]|jgi:hypothetical protein|nr:hypothetical protein [Thermoplasmata archaeon]MEA3165960.1 hypothetical protein [Thermoplasmata archaeon]
MDGSSTWERRFIAELQRTPREWQLRRRLLGVLSLIVVGGLGGFVVSQLHLHGWPIDSAYAGSIGMGLFLLVLFAVLYYWLGVMQGAAEHHRRQP